MSFRITTNGLFRTYGTAMRTQNKKVYDALERVQTNRKFAHFSEDPASAAKAFRLRRDHWRSTDFLDNTNFLISKQEIAYSAGSAIVNGDDRVPSLDGIYESLAGLSDTAGAGRKPLGYELSAKAESIASAMNVTFNEEFVFAGADGLNVPFTWDGDKLLYRGIDVSAETGSEDYERLQKMAAENTYVDIGQGMKENDQGVIPNSAYDSCLSGLTFLGYGTDEDGDSKNLAVLMRELGNLYQNCDPDTGDYPGINHDAQEANKARAQTLSLKIHDAINRVQEQHVALSAGSNFLQQNKRQLEETQFTLQEQISQVEKLDDTGALAIEEMAWAQYVYEAALHVGNDLLSHSLFDYM